MTELNGLFGQGDRNYDNSQLENQSLKDETPVKMEILDEINDN